jgi:hypothetical protein
MPPLLSWVDRVRELTPTALTVRAQTVDPTLQNRLLWDQFFPRVPVESTELDEIMEQQVEVEYVSERREWDTRGRPIPFQAPGRYKLEFIPIETYFEIMEKEINDLMLRFQGNQEMMINTIGPRIPRRTERIAAANFRRVEKDSFDGWSSGIITRRNPQLGHVAQTFNFNFAGTRYPTASPAWDAVGANAFNELIKMVPVADKMIGLVQGVIMRQATWDKVLADATAAISVSSTFPLLRLTTPEVEARLNQELRRQFTVVIFEDTLTTFTDGGITATAEVNRWPAEKVGFIPAANNGAVGFTAFAPVVRAYELSQQVPGAGIDVRGNTVYHFADNGGRQLTVECQLNAMPVPFEDRMFVVNVGV